MIEVPKGPLGTESLDGVRTRSLLHSGSYLLSAKEGWTEEKPQGREELA